MNVIELRNKIIRAVKSADEEYLRQLEAFINSEKKELSLSDEHKTILDERLAKHASNPREGKPWQKLKTELSSKYGV